MMPLRDAYALTLEEKRYATAKDFWERVAAKMGRTATSWAPVRRAAMEMGLPPVQPAVGQRKKRLNAIFDESRGTYGPHALPRKR